jgi:hypothetical protein
MGNKLSTGLLDIANFGRMISHGMISVVVKRDSQTDYLVLYVSYDELRDVCVS